MDEYHFESDVTRCAGDCTRADAPLFETSRSLVGGALTLLLWWW